MIQHHTTCIKCKYFINYLCYQNSPTAELDNYDNIITIRPSINRNDKVCHNFVCKYNHWVFCDSDCNDFSNDFGGCRIDE